MSKKRILVIHLDYCFENANTIIVERIIHLLRLKFDIDIATYDIKGSNHRYDLDQECIKAVKYYSLNKELNTANIKIRDVVKILHFNIKKRICKNRLDEKNTLYFIKQLCKELQICNYDLLLSFSNPFSSHYAASLLSKEFDVPWIAYYLDPFFTNATYDKNGLERRKKLEERITHHAKAIYLTYPISNDYIDNQFENRDIIKRIEMPGIRKEMHAQNVNRSGDVAQCYFVGNLYADIRNPGATISLFSKMEGSAELFFVGGCYGNIPSLTERQYKNIHYLGRIPQDEIKAIYEKADFLINIGNLIINQMPSKIFEYISTGKPIINFYKTTKCPTLKYTEKYPLCVNIFEEDLIRFPDETFRIVNDFINDTQGISLSSDKICKIFQENMDESVTEELANKIEEEIQ